MASRLSARMPGGGRNYIRTNPSTTAQPTAANVLPDVLEVDILMVPVYRQLDKSTNPNNTLNGEVYWYVHSDVLVNQKWLTQSNIKIQIRTTHRSHIHDAAVRRRVEELTSTSLSAPQIQPLQPVVISQTADQYVGLDALNVNESVQIRLLPLLPPVLFSTDATLMNSNNGSNKNVINNNNSVNELPCQTIVRVQDRVVYMEDVNVKPRVAPFQQNIMLPIEIREASQTLSRRPNQVKERNAEQQRLPLLIRTVRLVRVPTELPIAIDNNNQVSRLDIRALPRLQFQSLLQQESRLCNQVRSLVSMMPLQLPAAPLNRVRIRERDSIVAMALSKFTADTFVRFRTSNFTELLKTSQAVLQTLEHYQPNRRIQTTAKLFLPQTFVRAGAVFSINRRMSHALQIPLSTSNETDLVSSIRQYYLMQALLWVAARSLIEISLPGYLVDQYRAVLFPLDSTFRQALSKTVRTWTVTQLYDEIHRPIHDLIVSQFRLGKPEATVSIYQPPTHVCTLSQYQQAWHHMLTFMDFSDPSSKVALSNPIVTDKVPHVSSTTYTPSLTLGRSINNNAGPPMFYCPAGINLMQAAFLEAVRLEPNWLSHTAQHWVNMITYAFEDNLFWEAQNWYHILAHYKSNS